MSINYKTIITVDNENLFEDKTKKKLPYRN